MQRDQRAGFPVSREGAVALPTCDVEGCDLKVVWKEGEGWLHVIDDGDQASGYVTGVHRHNDATGHDAHADFLGDW